MFQGENRKSKNYCILEIVSAFERAPICQNPSSQSFYQLVWHWASGTLGPTILSLALAGQLDLASNSHNSSSMRFSDSVQKPACLENYPLSSESTCNTLAPIWNFETSTFWVLWLWVSRSSKWSIPRDSTPNSTPARKFWRRSSNSMPSKFGH